MKGKDDQNVKEFESIIFPLLWKNINKQWTLLGDLLVAYQ